MCTHKAFAGCHNTCCILIHICVRTDGLVLLMVSALIWCWSTLYTIGFGMHEIWYHRSPPCALHDESNPNPCCWLISRPASTRMRRWRRASSMSTESLPTMKLDPPILPSPPNPSLPGPWKVGQQQCSESVAVGQWGFLFVCFLVSKWMGLFVGGWVCGWMDCWVSGCVCWWVAACVRFDGCVGGWVRK